MLNIDSVTNYYHHFSCATQTPQADVSTAMYYIVRIETLCCRARACPGWAAHTVNKHKCISRVGMLNIDSVISYCQYSSCSTQPCLPGRRGKPAALLC